MADRVAGKSGQGLYPADEQTIEHILIRSHPNKQEVPWCTTTLTDGTTRCHQAPQQGAALSAAHELLDSIDNQQHIASQVIDKIDNRLSWRSIAQAIKHQFPY